MFYVCTIQKKTDGTYANTMSRYDTFDAAKVKAYTELAYGFGSELALCSVCIMDDYTNTLLSDTYTKPTETESATETTEASTTTASA